MWRKVYFNTVGEETDWISMNGLERVLEEVMGESAWLKVRSDLYPESCREEALLTSDNEEPQDWDPTTPCFVCQGNSQGSLVPEIVRDETSTTTKGGGATAIQSPPRRTTSESPVPPKVLTPNSISHKQCNQDDEGGCPEATLDLSVSRSPGATASPVASSSPSLGGALHKSYSGGIIGGTGASERTLGTMGSLGHDAATPRLPLDLYTANLPPHLLPWILQSHLHQLARVHHAQQQDPPEIAIDDKDQQPLDLSAKSHQQLLQVKPEYNNIPISSSASPNTLSSATTSLFPYKRIKNETPVDVKMPSNRGRRRGDMSKRSYTEEELQAALRDIQSGKLGTRRAAVIYGIPRSTLRNKVYKLAMERERNKKLAEQNSAPAVNKDTKSIPPHQNGIVDVSTGSLGNTNYEDTDTSPETFRALLRSKMAEKLKEMNQKGLSGEDNEKVAESALKYLMENIPKLALNEDNKQISTEILSSISFCPQLSDFIKKIVGEQYNEVLQRSKSSRLNGSDEIHAVNGFNHETCDLTVPSYFPSCNGHSKGESDSTTTDSNHSSQPLISSLQNSNLKEMIAQMIGQKLGCELPLSKDEKVGSYEGENIEQLSLAFSTQSDSLPKFGGEKRDQSQTNKKASTLTAGAGTGGKGSRPKRGKYRNYDRDNLLKAVQAVQSGEMSVHRAGSFYGVPHSTLEYKVKERHLTRGRNKKDQGSSSCSPAAKIKKEIIRKSADTTTATIDLTGDEISKSDDKTEATPAVKKPRIDAEASPFSSYPPLSSSLSQTPASSTPIIPNPFSLWNGNPVVPSFLQRYQQDPFYASQMIRRFQEAAAAKSQSDNDSITPPVNERSCSPNSEPVTQETLESPPFQGSVLDALLRGKIAAINNKLASSCSNNNSALPNNDTWQVSSSLLNLSKGLVTENQKPQLKREESSTPPLISPPGIMPFSALYTLPILAARNSLAAALQQQPSPRDTSSPEVDILPLPLVKESCHPTPVVADQP